MFSAENRRMFPLAIAAALGFAGCNSDDEKVFKEGEGSFETKPEATLLADIANEGAGGDGFNAAPTEVADITYKISVTSNSGAKLCKGTVNLVLMSNFSFNFPEAFARCSSMTLNLEGLLAGGLGADGQGGGGFLEGDGGELPISHDGKALYLEEIAGTSFSPARPFLLGPIVTNNGKYKDYEKKTKTNATTKDGKSGSGTFTVTVLEHEAEYENEFMKNNDAEPFDKVINWTMEADGFDGFAMSDGLIVEYWEWHWNTRPVMIPAIKIKGEMGDLIGGEQGGTEIVGKITINIEVASYDIID